MSEPDTDQRPRGGDRPRKFLVVVDKSPEGKVALRFAARRAMHTGGRVCLLCVAKPGDFQQWKGVEDIMKDEAHQEAENLLHTAAKIINEVAGVIPELVIEHGQPRESLMALIKRDKDISILVLASGTGKEGPGPLVSLFSAPGAHPIPVTLVPGNLSEDEIDALA